MSKQYPPIVFLESPEAGGLRAERAAALAELRREFHEVLREEIKGGALLHTLALFLCLSYFEDSCQTSSLSGPLVTLSFFVHPYFEIDP